MTRHRDWAWVLVGTEKRDQMVAAIYENIERAALEPQKLDLVKAGSVEASNELIKMKSVSTRFFDGKLLYVFDPRHIRVVTTSRKNQGEMLLDMSERTGAIAGVNGGGFYDPEAKGDGSEPTGVVISNYQTMYQEFNSEAAKHIVGFTGEGQLVVGKYNPSDYSRLGLKEAVNFYPRIIANGRGLIEHGDGGWGRAPRTAVGQRADGVVVFVVIDGRQQDSDGATLKEVQDLLLEEGCIIAGMLDGGGSSAMVVNHEMVSDPSYKRGRPMPTAFMVFEDPDALQNELVWENKTHTE